MNTHEKIFVAGHRGMVGSALVRALRAQGYTNLILRTRQELDLTEAREVSAFYQKEKPDYVIVAAARVGGILANNTYPVEFLTENLQIELNLLGGAHQHGVKKTLFLGSSCIYPREAPQPLREESLLTGPLEPTNEAYALAKICGIRLGQYYRRQYGTSFISGMPTNLYGPEDNFDLQTSHVLPAMIRRFHEAKKQRTPTLTLWGTGTPLREFLHVDDVAEACLHLLHHYDAADFINIGCGTDLSIKELAHLIQRIVGYSGEILWDTTKPDGTPRKLMDVSRLTALGWKSKISLEEGIASTYAWWLAQSNTSSSK